MLIFYLMQFEDINEQTLFAEIYEQNVGRMYSIAKSILTSNQLAEEAVHDTFLKVIDNFEKVSALSPKMCQGWINVVVKNISLNILKKEKRSFPIENEKLFTISSDENDREYNYLIEAINNLPEKYRDVLEMYYLLGYDSNEIASLLGITSDNVLQRMSRARKLLLEELNEEK